MGKQTATLIKINQCIDPMKMIKSTSLSLLLVASALIGQGAEQYRADINPALRYYQAFISAPSLPEADKQYLLDREWRGQTLPPRFGTLVSNYDNAFKFLRQAEHASVKCDWGIDLSEGPFALLPGLAKNKSLAQAARARVMWDLQNGKQAEARDDLLAVFELAHNTSQDGVLISALVQVAIENIVFSIVAENFHQFSPETLKQLVEGFGQSTPRGTMAQCIAVEKAFFHDWFVRRIGESQKAHPNDDAQTLREVRDLLLATEGGEGADPGFPDKLIQSAGGKVEGVLRLLQEIEPFYPRVAALLTLPYQEFEPQIKAFNVEVQKHPNPLVPKFFSVFERCRQKEFSSIVRFALVRAATEYKLHGEAGLQSVRDPYGDAPFAFRRFVFEGVDRGFELKSAYYGRDYNESLIFVEKDGPPFRLDGKNAGKALPNESTGK